MLAEFPEKQKRFGLVTTLRHNGGHFHSKSGTIKTKGGRKLEIFAKFIRIFIVKDRDFPELPRFFRCAIFRSNYVHYSTFFCQRRQIEAVNYAFLSESLITQHLNLFQLIIVLTI